MSVHNDIIKLNTITSQQTHLMIISNLKLHHTQKQGRDVAMMCMPLTDRVILMLKQTDHSSGRRSCYISIVLFK